MKNLYNPAVEKPFFIDNDGARNYDFQKSISFLQFKGQKKFGMNFKIEKADFPIIYKLLIYFTYCKDRCIANGIDTNKGILLAGPIGCGKTALMSLMNEFTFEFNHFFFQSSRIIAAEFYNDGYTVIHKYSNLRKIYCFDDLGTEHNTKHFGNECNTIAEILLNRYDLMKKQGFVTHATTNLSASDLESIYGNRVRSRMREMFNLIAFPNNTPDKRT